MRFLFLNQYGPPDPVPTARLLGELAEGLRQDGHAVEILCPSQSYQDRPARGGSRLRRELQASWAILRSGLRPSGGRPEVILALSSPPGLLVVSALLALWHRARLAHWAMDLYPELAVSLGEVRPDSIVVRIVRAAMRWAYGQAALVIALDQDMRDHLQPLCRARVRVMEPWSASAVEQQADALSGDVPSHDPPPTIWTWLYSGNLGRAHDWQTLLDAQGLLEKRALPIHLVFQGDGASCAPAKAYATKLGLSRCEWRTYAPEAELLLTLQSAQILIVTQRPETRGLLWPSKLALLERLPRPILFVGPEDGAIAERLRARGNAGIFAPGQAEEVAAYVEGWFRSMIVWQRHQSHPLPSQAEQRRTMEGWLLECGHHSA